MFLYQFPSIHKKKRGRIPVQITLCTRRAIRKQILTDIEMALNVTGSCFLENLSRTSKAVALQRMSHVTVYYIWHFLRRWAYTLLV